MSANVGHDRKGPGIQLSRNSANVAGSTTDRDVGRVRLDHVAVLAIQAIIYQITTTRPGAEPASQRTTFTSLEGEATTRQNCLSVVAVNRDGRPSAPLERCVTVP